VTVCAGANGAEGGSGAIDACCMSFSQLWLPSPELEHAIGVAACRALAHGDTISRAELVERTVLLLVQSSNDAVHRVLSAHRVDRKAQSCGELR
jgi:hypothetical protein